MNVLNNDEQNGQPQSGKPQPRRKYPLRPRYHAVHFGVGLNATQIKTIANCLLAALAIQKTNGKSAHGLIKLEYRFYKLMKKHPVRGASRKWGKQFGLNVKR